MAQLTPAQKTALLNIIQSVGDLPTFVTAVQAAYTGNFKTTGSTALSGVVLTVADWTAVNNQIAAAAASDPTVLGSLMSDIAASISGTNAATLGPQLVLLYCMVKKYLGV